jgi:hypothetical protein
MRMRLSERFGTREWNLIGTIALTLCVLAGLTALTPRLSEQGSPPMPTPSSIVGAARRADPGDPSSALPEAAAATVRSILTASSTTTPASIPSIGTPSTSAAPTVDPSAPVAPRGPVSPAVSPGPGAPAVPPLAAPSTTVPPPAAPPSIAPPSIAPPPLAAPVGVRCFVRLHGKSGTGEATIIDSAGVTVVSPTGNVAGWGGRQWLYYPESSYQAARSIVDNAISGANCGRVVLYGFSNGASFAAKLLCRGETFGNRLVGVIIDDPVTDHAVEGCARSAGVHVALYTTGAIDMSAGWDCRPDDWTCEGGTTIGTAAYAAAIGVGRQASIRTTHEGWDTPPERTAWW